MLKNQIVTNSTATGPGIGKLLYSTSGKASLVSNDINFGCRSVNIMDFNDGCNDDIDTGNRSDDGRAKALSLVSEGPLHSEDSNQYYHDNDFDYHHQRKPLHQQQKLQKFYKGTKKAPKICGGAFGYSDCIDERNAKNCSEERRVEVMSRQDQDLCLTCHSTSSATPKKIKNSKMSTSRGDPILHGSLSSSECTNPELETLMNRYFPSSDDSSENNGHISTYTGGCDQAEGEDDDEDDSSWHSDSLCYHRSLNLQNEEHWQIMSRSSDISDSRFKSTSHRNYSRLRNYERQRLTKSPLKNRRRRRRRRREHLNNRLKHIGDEDEDDDAYYESSLLNSYGNKPPIFENTLPNYPIQYNTQRQWQKHYDHTENQHYYPTNHSATINTHCGSISMTNITASRPTSIWMEQARRRYLMNEIQRTKRLQEDSNVVTTPDAGSTPANGCGDNSWNAHSSMKAEEDTTYYGCDTSSSSHDRGAIDTKHHVVFDRSSVVKNLDFELLQDNEGCAPNTKNDVSEENKQSSKNNVEDKQQLQQQEEVIRSSFSREEEDLQSQITIEPEDIELTERARQIQDDLRFHELEELAWEAERAAEAGEEKFVGNATTFTGVDSNSSHHVDHYVGGGAVPGSSSSWVSGGGGGSTTTAAAGNSKSVRRRRTGRLGLRGQSFTKISASNIYDKRHVAVEDRRWADGGNAVDRYEIESNRRKKNHRGQQHLGRSDTACRSDIIHGSPTNRHRRKTVNSEDYGIFHFQAPLPYSNSYDSYQDGVDNGPSYGEIPETPPPPTLRHISQTTFKARRPQPINNRGISAPDELQLRLQNLELLPPHAATTSMSTPSSFLMGHHNSSLRGVPSASQKKIRVLALRHIAEVIPTFDEMHQNLRTHMARKDVDANILVSIKHSSSSDNNTNHSKDEKTATEEEATFHEDEKESLAESLTSSFLKNTTNFQNSEMLQSISSFVLKATTSTKGNKASSDDNRNIGINTDDTKTSGNKHQNENTERQKEDSNLTAVPLQSLPVCYSPTSPKSDCSPDHPVDCASFVSCGATSRDELSRQIISTPDKKMNMKHININNDFSDTDSTCSSIYVSTLASELHTPGRRKRANSFCPPIAPYGSDDDHENIVQQLTPPRTVCSEPMINGVPKSPWTSFWETLSPKMKGPFSNSISAHSHLRLKTHSLSTEALAWLSAPSFDRNFSKNSNNFIASPNDITPMVDCSKCDDDKKDLTRERSSSDQAADPKIHLPPKLKKLATDKKSMNNWKLDKNEGNVLPLKLYGSDSILNTSTSSNAAECKGYASMEDSNFTGDLTAGTKDHCDDIVHSFSETIESKGILLVKSSEDSDDDPIIRNRRLLAYEFSSDSSVDFSTCSNTAFANFSNTALNKSATSMTSIISQSSPVIREMTWDSSEKDVLTSNANGIAENQSFYPDNSQPSDVNLLQEQETFIVYDTCVDRLNEESGSSEKEMRVSTKDVSSNHGEEKKNGDDQLFTQSHSSPNTQTKRSLANDNTSYLNEYSAYTSAHDRVCSDCQCHENLNFEYQEIKLNQKGLDEVQDCSMRNSIRDVTLINSIENDNKAIEGMSVHFINERQFVKENIKLETSLPINSLPLPMSGSLVDAVDDCRTQKQSEKAYQPSDQEPVLMQISQVYESSRSEISLPPFSKKAGYCQKSFSKPKIEHMSCDGTEDDYIYQVGSHTQHSNVQTLGRSHSHSSSNELRTAAKEPSQETYSDSGSSSFFADQHDDTSNFINCGDLNARAASDIEILTRLSRSSQEKCFTENTTTVEGTKEVDAVSAVSDKPPLYPAVIRQLYVEKGILKNSSDDSLPKKAISYKVSKNQKLSTGDEMQPHVSSHKINRASKLQITFSNGQSDDVLMENSNVERNDQAVSVFQKKHSSEETPGQNPDVRTWKEDSECDERSISSNNKEDIIEETINYSGKELRGNGGIKGKVSIKSSYNDISTHDGTSQVTNIDFTDKNHIRQDSLGSVHSFCFGSGSIIDDSSICGSKQEADAIGVESQGIVNRFIENQREGARSPVIEELLEKVPSVIGKLSPFMGKNLQDTSSHYQDDVAFVENYFYIGLDEGIEDPIHPQKVELESVPDRNKFCGRCNDIGAYNGCTEFGISVMDTAMDLLPGQKSERNTHPRSLSLGETVPNEQPWLNTAISQCAGEGIHSHIRTAFSQCAGERIGPRGEVKVGGRLFRAPLLQAKNGALPSEMVESNTFEGNVLESEEMDSSGHRRIVYRQKSWEVYHSVLPPQTKSLTANHIIETSSSAITDLVDEDNFIVLQEFFVQSPCEIEVVASSTKPFSREKKKRMIERTQSILDLTEDESSFYNEVISSNIESSKEN